jgi:hypothetical protein
MSSTEWKNYGTESGNPKCSNCMVHSGYEASAVDDTFASIKGFFATARATLFRAYPDQAALESLDERSAPASDLGLVQLNVRAARSPAEPHTLKA